MASTIILSDNGVSSGSAGLKETGGNDGVLILQTTTSGGTATNAVYIDASQNVGIGTSSPAEKLAVTNTALTSTTVLANTVAAFRSNASGADTNIKLSDGVTYSANIGQNSGNIYFAPNGTEKMRIDTSGNLLVGATATSGSAKTYIYQSAAAQALLVNVAAASSQSSPCVTFAKADNTTTTSQVFAQFVVNNLGSGSGQINANGANAAAFGSYSDSRLKENITDLPSQLTNIMALRPVEYDYIESEGGGHQIGFVAQEVREVYPDLVGERADGMLTLTDLNKNDARLIKAIQEQQALITTLTERITALEAK